MNCEDRADRSCLTWSARSTWSCLNLDPRHSRERAFLSPKCTRVFEQCTRFLNLPRRVGRRTKLTSRTESFSLLRSQELSFPLLISFMHHFFLFLLDFLLPLSFEFSLHLNHICNLRRYISFPNLSLICQVSQAPFWVLHINYELIYSRFLIHCATNYKISRRLGLHCLGDPLTKCQMEFLLSLMNNKTFFTLQKII